MTTEHEMTVRELLNEVVSERKRQVAKWGYQNLTPAQYALILGEEKGEVDREIIETHFNGLNPDKVEHLREELIQLAAVAIQFIECIDNNTPDRVDRRFQEHQAFYEWADAFFSKEWRLDCFIQMGALFAKYKSETGVHCSRQRFKMCLNSWTRERGFILNPMQDIISQRVVLRPAMASSPVEVVYIQTASFVPITSIMRSID